MNACLSLFFFHLPAKILHLTMIMHNTPLSIEIFTLDTKPVLFNDFGGSCQSLSWRHKHTKNESVSAKREHHADFFANVWMENLGRGSKIQILSHHSHCAWKTLPNVSLCQKLFKKVQSLIVMPSKLWRFEWSERGTIRALILRKLRYFPPKLGSKMYMILLLKT